MVIRSILLVCVLLVATFTTPAMAAEKPYGIWRNPKNSVHVRIQPCGREMCGVVVWANEKAKADAAKGGTKKLVGSALFQSFVPESAGVWRGKVFVPDIGQTFSGTISVLDNDHIEGKGCLLGRVGCKSQTWSRIK